MIGHYLNYSAMSDADLLKRLIGARAVRRPYRGQLGALFSPAPDAAEVSERCVVARDLVQRWLAEQMRNRPALASPSAVRDYLRIYFPGRKHECFIVLFLDAQNHLILAEQLFRGTLTQTSVYPREVVKAALRYNAGAVVFAHNPFKTGTLLAIPSSAVLNAAMFGSPEAKSAATEDEREPAFNSDGNFAAGWVQFP